MFLIANYDWMENLASYRVGLDLVQDNDLYMVKVFNISISQ